MTQTAAHLAEKGTASEPRRRPVSQELFRQSRSNELFIAVVGPAGSGVGTAAGVLKSYLEQQVVDEVTYEVTIIKASHEIKRWAEINGHQVPPGARKTLDNMIAMQNLGDTMRFSKKDNAAVAMAVMGKIREVRAKISSLPPGQIDGRPRAYIIDSLRHPAEAHLLRRIYQDAFSLIGVVCDPIVRDQRLRNELYEYKDRQLPATKKAIAEVMDRDADAPEKHGQHVTDTFQEADFFIDNSLNTEDIARTGMNDPLRRFVKLITSVQVERPTIAETAMHHAHSAQLRSACLSRQVGAALVDSNGNIIATGTNEVPKAGGGVYGTAFDGEISADNRCAMLETKFCSSNREQNEIIEELLEKFPSLTEGRLRKDVVEELRRTRLGGLIEFSRAVHAEMDAILSAARVGVSSRGTRLFVSTFPCHYCARHIVSAGVDEVQYIEPYPKSRALKLHCDSITTEATEWEPPSSPQKQGQERPQKQSDPASALRKVLFRPFVGVAPRMYRKVFLKDRDYKDKSTGEFIIAEPDWGSPADISALRYTELEEKLGAVSI